MARQPSPAARQYQCERCPLRPLPVFRDFTGEELGFIGSFKKGELIVDKGATVLVEGSHSPHLFTVLAGWGFRYKLMEDGQRQILNFLVPGDLIGLQAALTHEMQHSVEALSPMLLCVFERDQLKQLYAKHSELAFDVTWLASREEQMLDEHLLSIGRRSAIERAAYLLSFIDQRARAVKLLDGNRRRIPITQQHVADTLGLSIVHTNKTLRKLAARKLIAWGDGGCEVLDQAGLLAAANWEGLGERPRPLL